MKKLLLLGATLLFPAVAAFAQDTGKKYPKPIERRIPWTVIAGSEKSVPNALDGKTTGAAADLIDRNPLTYWITDASQCDANDPNHLHWFMIDRGIEAEPFNKISFRQMIVQTGDADETTAEWIGAVDQADIYVMDEFIGLLGGNDNKDYDNDLLMSYVVRQDPTLHVSMEIFTQECQIFDFPTTQTGRYILVAITHTVNPNGNQTHNNRQASLAEVELFSDEDIEISDFDGDYAIGLNPENIASADKRTHYLEFSNVFIDQIRSTPFLQSTSDFDPYTDNLNWLEWDKTFFDITNLYTFRAGIGNSFELMPNAVGEGLYQALYIDWDGNGFDEEAIAKTDAVGNLNSTLTVNIPDDAIAGVYRARYIVDSQNESSTPSDQIANGGIVVDFNIEIGKKVTFTAKLMYDGLLVETRTDLTGYAGAPFKFNSPDFFTAAVVGVAPENDGDEIELNMASLNLPFAFTTLQDGEQLDFNNLKWQAIHHNTNTQNVTSGGWLPYKNAAWTYSEDDGTVKMEATTDDVNTEGYKDTQLWAFVGDIVNGFKIYNKAAGKEVWAGTDNAARTEDNNAILKVGAFDTYYLWKPVKSTTGLTHTRCALAFTEKNTDSETVYPNHKTNNLAQLNFHNNPGPNSTSWFVAANVPMVKTVSNYTFDESGANYVGEYVYTGSENVEVPAELIANATANPYDIQYTNLLRELIDNLEKNKQQVKMPLNKWYRFKNHATEKSGCWMTTNVEDDELHATYYTSLGGVLDKTDYHNLFYAEQINGSDGFGDTDRFYLASQGKYLAKFPDTNNNGGNLHIKQQDGSTDAAEFLIGSRNGALINGQTINSVAAWSIIEQTYEKAKPSQVAEKNHISIIAGDVIANWGPYTMPVLWNIAPAEDIDVKLTKLHNGISVGFGYFPFAVTTAEGSATTLHEVYADTDASGNAILSNREVKSVPAHTAFMIMNKEYNIANLLIDYSASVAAVSDIYYDGPEETTAKTHVLSGSLRPTTVVQGDFILDPNSTTLEFIKSEEPDPALPGNYAYIPASVLPDTHKVVDKLPFNNDVDTSIEEITTEPLMPTMECIYDLQGRKLAAPAKGINIVNGKKVLVK